MQEQDGIYTKEVSRQIISNRLSRTVEGMIQKNYQAYIRNAFEMIPEVASDNWMSAKEKEKLKNVLENTDQYSVLH